MKTRYTVLLSMIAGAALGGAAIQGLHAQAKPKAYLVTESEVIDRPSVPPYDPLLASALQAAGGQWIGGAGPTEKITAVLGDPPKRFGVTAFEKHRELVLDQLKRRPKRLDPSLNSGGPGLGHHASGGWRAS